MTYLAWERFALDHPELQERVNVGCAPHRREKLSQVAVTVASHFSGVTPIKISNRAILSPRRIFRAWMLAYPAAYRESAARFAVRIADMTFKLLCDWRDEGYPDLDTNRSFTGTVGYWTATLRPEVPDAR